MDSSLQDESNGYPTRYVFMQKIHKISSNITLQVNLSGGLCLTMFQKPPWVSVYNFMFLHVVRPLFETEVRLKSLKQRVYCRTNTTHDQCLYLKAVKLK